MPEQAQVMPQRAIVDDIKLLYLFICMSVGIRIEKATVTYDPEGYRTLELVIDEKDILDFDGIKKLIPRQSGTKWAKEQLEKEAKRKNHEIASPYYPLRGYGVGMLLHKGEYALFVLKNRKKITPSSGFIENIEELRQPLLGAVRETMEEICFKNGTTLYTPQVENALQLDTSLSDKIINTYIREILEARFEIYKENGIVDRREDDKCIFYFSLGNLLGLPLDTIELKGPGYINTSRGFFYWDPSTAGVTLIYPAAVATEGLPFPGEIKFGTTKLDPNIEVVKVNQKKAVDIGMLEEGQKEKVLKARVYTLQGGEERTISVKPGGFNRAIYTESRQWEEDTESRPWDKR